MFRVSFASGRQVIDCACPPALEVNNRVNVYRVKVINRDRVDGCLPPGSEDKVEVVGI